MRRVLKYFFVLLLAVVGISSVQAQTSPVVYGVFFYSPTCSHCHEVINNHWGAVQEEFGDQLQVLFVNIQNPAGSQWMTVAREAMGIESSGVPMLIIGEDVMVGSLEIPARVRDVVRAGLASGGIGVPPVPGMEALFQEALGESYVPNDLAAGVQAQATIFTDPVTTLSDPANVVAIVVLLGLIASLLLVIGAGINRTVRTLVFGQIGSLVLLGTIVVGIGLAISLMLGSETWWVTAMVIAIGVGLVVSLVLLLKRWSLQTLTDALLPVLLLVGFMVAAYMTYIEVTASDAVCGLVGECNLVQQSQYAKVFGVPVGVIGLAGYVALFGVWLVGKQNPQARLLLLMLTLVGVTFSIYLTFLEPFVIGASCVWCLTSAIVMIALLWLVAPTVYEVEKSKLVPAEAL